MRSHAQMDAGGDVTLPLSLFGRTAEVGLAIFAEGDRPGAAVGGDQSEGWRSA
jgi:hypothetical protein